MPLSPADLTIIAAYVGSLLAISLWLRRRASAGLDHYLLAGRSKPWWKLGISGVMDFWDLAGSIVIVSFLYLMGPAGLLIEFRGGAVLILAVVMLWTGKWRRRSGCLTGAEWMRFRFGDGPAGKLAQSARAVAGVALFIGLVAYATKALGVFLSSITPLTPSQSALAVVSLVATYSVFSGFYGLVAIQVLQFGCVLISAFAVMGLAVCAAPPLEPLRAMAIEVTGNPAWGRLAPGGDLVLPAGYRQYEPLMFLATIYLVRNVLFGMGAGDDPKCFAARRQADCPKLSLLWVSLIAVRWPTMMAFAVLAITLVSEDRARGFDYRAASRAVRVHYPRGDWDAVVALVCGDAEAQPPSLQRALREAIGGDWPRRLTDVTESGVVDPERLIPRVLADAAPPGIRGLILVSLLAAATAGLSGWLNQAAGLFANDLYLVWIRPSAGVSEQIGATWAVVLGVVGLGYLLAFSSTTVNDIWSWLTMGLGSGLIVAQMLPLYWRRFNGVGFAAGLGGGLVAATVHRFVDPWLPTSVAIVNDEWRLLLLVLAAGLVAAILGTWLSPPTDAAVLSRFYRKTLPFGFWRPERESLSVDERRELAASHRREVGALPCALVYQVAIFLGPMMAVIGDWSTAAVCGAVAAGALGGLWLIYFRCLEREAAFVERIAATATDAD
ncbi:hypothetical protein [Botrimarina sp.]|uniref:sodium:solute symporter family transporter n=1 Tax=Botrimarina sp. TaxID=2795802 RepID=UPI0032EC1102